MKIGAPVACNGDELTSLIEKVIERRLRAKFVDVQPDGDVRFWGVDAEESPLLGRLRSFGHACFTEATGAPPTSAFIMVNHIDAATTPAGSGGGWHRDSLRSQYKAFAYLTVVERASQGAFAFLPGSNSGVFRFASALHRFITRGNRYSDRFVASLGLAGMRQHVVTLGPAIPFFLNTSLVHRGLPIEEGRRIMATVYMFDESPGEGFMPFVDDPSSHGEA